MVPGVAAAALCICASAWASQAVAHHTPCLFGLSVTSQQYFSFRTNQPSATNQQYFSLRTKPPAINHQPNEQTDRSKEHSWIFGSFFSK
jgi:hypothetical protein